jgi:CubicO group peptidase (beta-lactamase class C family)
MKLSNWHHDRTPPAANDVVRADAWTSKRNMGWTFRNTGATHGALMCPRDGTIVDLPDALDDPEAVESISYQDFFGQSATFGPALMAAQVEGLIVLKEGSVRYERYHDGFTRLDHHLWLSVTKSLVACCVGILADEGKLDPGAAVTTYIPELADSVFGGDTTVQHLLDMATTPDIEEGQVGLAALDPARADSWEMQWARAGRWAPNAKSAFPESGYQGLADVLQRLPKRDMGYAHGHVFRYESVNTDVLGWMVARLSEQPLQAFVSQRIWQRIGVAHDGFFFPDYGNIAMASGGFNSTLRDAARFGLMVLNRGRVNGQQVVPEAWLDRVATGVTEEDRDRMRRSTYGRPGNITSAPYLDAYKDQWWIMDGTNGVFMASGRHGQLVYINRPADVCAALFSTRFDGGNATSPTFKIALAGLHHYAQSLA